MHKSISKQFQLFSKAFGIPPKVLSGIIIIIPLLLGTSVALNLVSKTSDNRSRAVDGDGCVWCDADCVADEDELICENTDPVDGYDCRMWENAVCTMISLDPTATPTPEPTIQPDPTATPPIPTHTALPPPPGDPTPTTEPPQEICAIADIASMAYPEGYPADANPDCCVDGYDLAFLKTQFFANNSNADLNEDGKVNLWDYSFLVSLWLQGCVQEAF